MFSWNKLMNTADINRRVKKNVRRLGGLWNDAKDSSGGYFRTSSTNNKTYYISRQLSNDVSQNYSGYRSIFCIASNYKSKLLYKNRFLHLILIHVPFFYLKPRIYKPTCLQVTNKMAFV